jgi:ATP-binding cassette subfamily B multidrug efflux pump
MAYITARHKKEFVFVVICILVSVIAAMIGNSFMQIIIDDYILEMLNTGENLFGELLGVVLPMAAVFFMGAFGTLFYNRTIAKIGQKVLKEIRDDLFVKMQTFPISFFDSHTHGDIMSVYTNDTDTLRQFIAQSLPMMISSLVTIVFAFCFMLRFNLILTGIVVILSVVMVLVARVITRYSEQYFAKQQDSTGVVNSYIEEMFGGLKVVKVFCHEEAAKTRMRKLNEELYTNTLHANGAAGALMPIMSGFGNLQYLVIAIAGGSMALFGNGMFSTTLGTLISFLGLILQFTSSITQTAQQMNSAVLGFAGASRIFELMDNEPEKDEGYVTLVRTKEQNGELIESADGDIYAWKHPHHDGTLSYTRVQGNVVLDHVDFSYDGRKLVLHDISLYAKPGQKIAFVGATGAGKTTITNLINRFYDLADGKIRYDGINITKIRKPDLRRSMGIILQDVNLFTGTVMDNIRYGKLDATDEECIEAAKLSGADSFITRLPDGYQTMINGDNNNLSQGQCQLISIARAAVADPPVMIMDEATSSIDTRTEAIVQKGMDALMDGRTVFVIAHRLSTVRNSKAIMVLEQG